MQNKLYHHPKHGHVPRNINEIIEYDQINNFNTKLAVVLTKSIGSMYMAYCFVGLAFVGLLSILGVFPLTISLIITWLSQTLIQLVLLPVIMVGQNVLNKQQELQSEETYLTTQKSYHDIENIIAHQNIQDKELLSQSITLNQILSSLKKE